MTHWTCSRRLLASAFVVTAALAAPGAAEAQIPIPGIPQIVLDPKNLVENVRQVAQAAQQIDNQRQQILYQIQSLRKLQNPNWREIGGLVNQLDVLMRQGDALAYSAANLDALFRQTFPGYQLPAGWVASEQNRIQATRALATLRSSLAATQRQMQDLRPGMARLGQIKRQMGGIQGTQEAIELQSTLQGYVAEELMLLRQAVAVQTNTVAVAHARQVQRELQEQAVLEQIVRNTLSRPRPPSPGFDGRWRAP
jgi:P-type conjugative transfer protein TrbJ